MIPPSPQVFDAETLACRVVIPAHEGQLAALQFSRTNTRIATASLKGTVIRVFDTRDGSKLYELRRGLKRTASIFSLSFSPCGTFLACSSNTETVHVFKLDERSDPGEAGTYGSPPNDEGWYGYINSVVSASAGYLPSQVKISMSHRNLFKIFPLLLRSRTHSPRGEPSPRCTSPGPGPGPSAPSQCECSYNRILSLKN